MTITSSPRAAADAGPMSPGLRLLLSYAETVIGGSPGLAVVEGVAGPARTELLGGLGDRLAGDGWLRVAGASSPHERLVPYAPILNALGQAAGPALPRLSPTRAHAERLAGGLAAAVCSGRPTLLTFDDVQHFDGWSLRLLGDLLPELDRFPVLAVFTVDPVAGPADGVPDFLRTLHREAAVTLAV